jgi:hypothetical protein
MILGRVVRWTPSGMNMNSSIEAEDETSMLAVKD